MAQGGGARSGSVSARSRVHPARAAGAALGTLAAAAALLCMGLANAVAGEGGVGGQPDDLRVHAGAGGAAGSGGAGGLNDSDEASGGGQGGNALPTGPGAGSDGDIGIGTGVEGLGGAAGSGAGGAGAAGGAEVEYGGFGGGGGGGATGMADVAVGTSVSQPSNTTGGAGGAGGAGYWAAGGGGAGGWGAVVQGALQVGAGVQLSGGAGGVGGAALSQGGGGGSGGGGVYLDAGAGSSLNAGEITGGAGGAGGRGDPGADWGHAASSGGGGGAGGSGVAQHGGQFVNDGTVVGGAGGNGGNTVNPGDPDKWAAGGSGGDGGDALHMQSTGAAFTNNGALRGGRGGDAGVNESDAAHNGAVGTAGVGAQIVGNNNLLVNAGNIQGGLAADGVTHADAVRIQGDGNTLELRAGYSFNGGVSAAGAGNQLALGGDSNASFQVGDIGTQYQGFAAFRKTGASTWTLDGSTALVTPWTVQQGVLSIADDASLGDISGGLLLDGGALQTTASIDTLRTLHLGAAGGSLRPDAGTTLALRSAIDGTGNLTMDGAGTLALHAANNYSGATLVASGTLLAGAANTFSAASAHSVAAGATLDLAGHSQSVAALNNSGIVSLVGSAPGTVLTVTGPYVGNGGTLRLGTTLGDDSSPSDKLLLSGPTAVASGNTQVQITRQGGLGALTTGNGIEVIGTENGGSIQTGAFALQGGMVVGGAYEYRLYTTDSGGYLRSTLAPIVPDPVKPEPDPLQPDHAPQVPTYRAEVALLSALPGQMRESSLAMLGNLHQRVGDESGPAAGAAMGAPRQAWGRVISIDRDMRMGGTVSPSSRGRLSGLQAGTDLWANENWRAGVYVGQLDGDMGVSGFTSGFANFASGRNDLRNQFLGGYATYRQAGGFYADAVLQAGRHRYTASA